MLSCFHLSVLSTRCDALKSLPFVASISELWKYEPRSYVMLSRLTIDTTDESSMLWAFAC